MSERLHTWSYLCDTCRLSGYDMGIFGPPGTKWECWADNGVIPFMKKVTNGEQDPLEICPNYKPNDAHAEWPRGKGGRE